jgi:hypothetical protein
MLGIPTPNFCDASSEFGGSPTTGHPKDRRRRGIMRLAMLASLPPPCPVPAQNTGEMPGLAISMAVAT